MDNRVIPDVMSNIIVPQGMYPEYLCVDISIRSVSGTKGQKGEYLEDIEGS